MSVVDGQPRLHRLADCPDVDALRLALGSRAVAPQAKAIATHVDDVLFAPLRHLLVDRELVVIPAEGLRGLPWAALATCTGRPISIAPSVSTWLRAVTAPPVEGHDLWVAGPGLDHADHEVTQLHKRWGGRLLTGKESTVDAVLAAAGSAAMVHIAAHCLYRPDNPAYSYLELADGPLHFHALSRTRLLVLSACEAALALPPGTTTVIASTLPVPDATAADLVTAFHEHLRTGDSPAQALAKAQAEHGDRGFVCHGL
jgi:CHAT domain-containing protein